MTCTTTNWTLGMPYWDGIWDQNRDDAYTAADESWSGIHLYCDIETKATHAQLDDEYDWCRYTWTADGTGTTTATTDDLWWMLDDLLWGPLYWSWYHADGRELTVVEDRQRRGMPADDLLYDLEMRHIADLLRAQRPEL